MKVYVVLGGHYYEGYDPSSLQVFPHTKPGKVAAEKYEDALTNGEAGSYDRVHIELITVEE